MASPHEAFWEHERYALVGNSAEKPFPKLSYKALKEKGKTVFPVDPSASEVEGDQVYDDLASVPGPLDGVVIEVPKEETASWMEQAADAGVTRVWIHMGRETPEALAIAGERGIEVCSGTCAVQYIDRGFPHNIHRFFRKLSGNW
jgi:uncharacterized protein